MEQIDNHPPIDTAELCIDRRERLHLPALRLDYRPVDQRIHDFSEALETDVVVFAPERGPDPAFGGWIVTDTETGQTDQPGIFAAGDNTGKMQLVSVAIAEARKVAESIHQYLKLINE